MLKLMLYNGLKDYSKYPIDEFNRQFESQNYTLIKGSGANSLIDFVKDDLDDYINHVYSKLPSTQEESEEAFSELIGLIQNSSFEDEKGPDLLESVLSKVSIKIKDLKYFKDSDNWGDFFNHNLVLPTWSNVIDYYDLINDGMYNNEDGKNYKSLIKWLNQDSNITVLCKEKLTKNGVENSNYLNLLDSFVRQIVSETDIKLDSYRMIIESIDFSVNDIELEDLDHDKVSLLIQSDLIIFDSASYNVFKSFSEDVLAMFVSKHFDKFIELFSSLSVEDKFIVRLLETSLFDETKLGIFPMSIEKKNQIRLIEKLDFVNNKYDDGVYRKTASILNECHEEVTLSDGQLLSILRRIDEIGERKKYKKLFDFHKGLVDENSELSE